MAVNEWIVDYGVTYYVGEDGRKYTGTRTIDGQTCIFDADGALISNTIITGLRILMARRTSSMRQEICSKAAGTQPEAILFT